MTFSSSPPLPRLPKREPTSHKGDYGRALLVGGSRGMSGAIALAGMAALRGGAGLVTLAVPDVCLETVAAFEPSYMTLGLPHDGSGKMSLAARETIDARSKSASCVACGPGIGRSADVEQLVVWAYQALPQPMVVDADGLNALAAHPECLAHPGGPRVLTPHPGEFRRLEGEPIATSDQMAQRAVALAKRCGIVVVLKGHQTLVSDGKLAARNETGNPGMATGGSGDVLTGLIAALICQGLSPLDAARLGVHVHGLAGDLAAEKLGQTSLIASDLLHFIAHAFQRLDELS